MVERLPAMRETQIQSLGWEDPLAQGFGDCGAGSALIQTQLKFQRWIRNRNGCQKEVITHLGQALSWILHLFQPTLGDSKTPHSSFYRV